MNTLKFESIKDKSIGLSKLYKSFFSSLSSQLQMGKV